MTCEVRTELTGIKPLLKAFLAAAGWTAILTLSADAATFTVVNTNDSGSGSFRQALISANTNPGPDRISFQVSGAGVRTISPASALPSIAEPVVIDATTQSGYSGSPLVELNGASAGANAGLRLLAGGTTIRGLAINRFAASGIQIESAGSNVVQGNFIGTDATGSLRRGNGADGILINSSSWNLVGGTNTADKNVLSANGNGGIYLLNCSNNLVQGNFIGTSANGSAALGNTNSGVILNSTTTGRTVRNLIGGATTGVGNLISGNLYYGVVCAGVNTRSNLVQGNLIGSDLTGTVSLGNVLDGVALNDASGNQVGGVLSGAGNLISGNSQNGVGIRGLSATNNLVQGNLVGVTLSGRSALANRYSGINLVAGQNQVGGVESGAGNIISANLMAGVYLEPAASNNLIQGNFIGTDISGTNRLGNSANGISFQGASSNLVGGIAPAARNLISGNAVHGLQFFASSASNNLVQGNFIGTDATGRLPLGNRSSGIHLTTAANVIGGDASGAGNLISGNATNGILLDGLGASANVIQGNLVGTDVDGVRALTNGFKGDIPCAGIMLLGAPGNLIGGTSPGAGNVVSGNADAGITLDTSDTVGNRIQGNVIGADISGTQQLGNGREGIFLRSAASNLIGGSVIGSGNLISANSTRGVYLRGAPGNVIQGNLIGTQRDGVSNLANGAGIYPSHAVECEPGANNNTISSNRIAYSRTVYSGVRIRDNSFGNAILDNAIFSNGGMGIDLGAATVSANDPCDTDGGANELQNFPVLNSVVSGADSTTISGLLNSAPNSLFLVQFFANPACGTGGFGEGQIPLGQTTLTTGADCNASFVTSLNVMVPPGCFITATATAVLSSNTSEFSACRVVTGVGTISLSDLTATYDGLPKPVSVTTSPTNLAVSVTYNGSTNVPVNAGAYAVVATLSGGSYQGQTNGTLVIAKAGQNISFSALQDQRFGVPVLLTATASSGLPVSFEVVSGPATLTGSLLSFTGIGPVTVRAVQAGNGNYLAASEVPRSFNVIKGLATVLLDDLSTTFDGNAKLVSALTIPTNLAVAVTYAGTTQPPTNAGTYAVAAEIIEPYYSGATNATLTIGKASQTITFAPVADASYGTWLILNATASSALPVGYEVVSGPATLADAVVSFTGIGAVTVRATQTGNSNYFAAIPVTNTFSVSKGAADVTLSNLNAIYDGSSKPVAVNVTPSNLTVTVTYAGSTTPPTNAGTYAVIVTVNDTNYAGGTNGTLVIDKASQSITFGPLTDQYYGTPLTLNATASSRLPVTYEVISGPANLVGPVLNFTGIGPVNVRATQAGNSNYLAAPAVTRGLIVNQGLAIVTLDQLAAIYDGTAKPVTVSTVPTNLNVIVTYGDSPLAPTNAGSYPVVATICETNFQGATNGTLVIGKASQTISFAPLPDKSVNDIPFLLEANASSGLDVAFSCDSLDVAAVFGNLVFILGAGSANITAAQPGSNNYLAAPEVSRTLTVRGLSVPLTISRISESQLAISWPATGATGLVLKTASSLATPIAWTTVPQTGTVQNGTVTVLVPIQAGAQVYALIAQ